MADLQHANYSSNQRQESVRQLYSILPPYQQGFLVTSMNGAGLQRWRRAWDDAKYACAKILWFGDSTTFGSYSDNVDKNTLDRDADFLSTIGQMRNMFQNALGGNAAGFQSVQSDYCTRVNTSIASFVQAPNGMVGIISNTGTCTFAIPASTTLELVSWEDNGADGASVTGDYSYNIDAAGAVAVPYTGLANQWKMTRITGLANQAHTVVITGTSANTPRFVGINYYGAGAIGGLAGLGGGVSIARHGRPGWSVADALGRGFNNGAIGTGQQVGQQIGLNAAQQLSLIRSFSTNGPDLVVVQYGINDWAHSATQSWASNISQYESNLRQIAKQVTVDAAKPAALLLVADNFTNATPDAGFVNSQEDFNLVMRKIALDTPNVSYIRIADKLGTWATANAAGLMGDNSHPFRGGYGAIAHGIFQSIATGWYPEVVPQII